MTNKKLKTLVVMEPSKFCELIKRNLGKDNVLVARGCLEALEYVETFKQEISVIFANGSANNAIYEIIRHIKTLYPEIQIFMSLDQKDYENIEVREKLRKLSVDFIGLKMDKSQTLKQII